MKLVHKKSLIDKLALSNKEDQLLVAENLADFISAIENHDLSDKKELIKIVFRNPLKAIRLDESQYELPYFANDIYDTQAANESSQIYMDNGCSLIEIVDSSMSNSFCFYGHPELTSEFENNNTNEILMLKPLMVFDSYKGAGFGTFNHANIKRKIK